MKYEIDKQDRYCVFTLDEKTINSIMAPQLKSEFVFLNNEGVKNLIFNMAAVDYVDSSGLSAILTANRLWKNILTNIASESVQKLIEISKLDGILTIVPTLDESIEYVHMEEIERDMEDEEEGEDDDSDDDE